MTNKEAIEHAEKIKEYCSEHKCDNCIFGTDSDYCCELASDSGPDGWMLDHLKEET